MNDDNAITMYEACLLHSRADRALRVVVSRQLEHFNVTMMEWLLMGVVCAGAKDGMTMTAVASALDVTLPQVTALTSSLTKSKLVKQKVSRQDRRSRRLVCTPSGKRLVEDTEKAIAGAMKDWTKDIPREELEAYYKTVKHLANRRSSDTSS